MIKLYLMKYGEKSMSKKIIGRNFKFNKTLKNVDKCDTMYS